jgi:hypothetical protein
MRLQPLSEDFRVALTVALRDWFPDLRHKFVRNIHRRPERLNAGLILRQCILFSLLFVMGEYSSQFVFVPIWRKLFVAHYSSVWWGCDPVACL